MINVTKHIAPIGPGAVLFDVTPHQLDAITGERLPRRYRQQLRRYRYGPGAFKIDYALSGPIPWRAEVCRRAATVHVGGSSDEVARSEAEMANGRICERPFVLVAQQSQFDETRAPAGRHTGWAYCHVPNGSTVDMTGRIERQIERFAPGFRDLILARHVMPPAALEARNPNLVGGDIGGGSNTLSQFLLSLSLLESLYNAGSPTVRVLELHSSGRRSARDVWILGCPHGAATYLRKGTTGRIGHSRVSATNRMGSGRLSALGDLHCFRSSPCINSSNRFFRRSFACGDFTSPSASGWDFSSSG